MKRLILAVMAMMLMGAWAQTASAVVFIDQGNVKLSAEKGNGRIHVVGDPKALDDYLKDMQYCPDQVKYTVGCASTWPLDVERVSPTEAVFQLDMAAVARGQRAFNFKKGVQWSQVSAFKIEGDNLVVEMSDPNPDSEDGRGGCHYTYIGDLPAGSYVPYKPEVCGGGYVKPVAKPRSTAVAKGVSGEGGVAVADNQGAAAAENSAAATTQSAAATNSSDAVATSMVNNNVSGKNAKGFVYAPNATNNAKSAIARGGSVDIKIKAKKFKGNIVSYVGPTYISIHQGTGAGDYDPYKCIKCHSNSAKEDEHMRRLVQKAMSSAASENCNKKSVKKGKK